MTIAIVSLTAAVLAALIGGWAVMIGNNRQAWINALREDLAQFFTNVDAIHFKIAALSQGGQMSDLEDERKVRSKILLSYRRILMRLNMNEPPHQQLEKALERLLTVREKTVNEDDLAQAVALARNVLKQEWNVTKYGLFTKPIVAFKRWWGRPVSRAA